MKKRTRVKTGAYGACVGFGVVATTILTLTLGPIGLAGGIIATACGLKAAKNDAEREMNKVFTDDDEQKLTSALNKDHFKSSMIYHNSAGNNPLMSSLFGNDITIENDYSEK